MGLIMKRLSTLVLSLILSLLVLDCLPTHAATWSRKYLQVYAWGEKSWAKSPDGTLTVAGSGNEDITLDMLDADGQPLRRVVMGDADVNENPCIAELADGGHILAFRTYYQSDGHYHSRVVRLESSGEVRWSKAYLGGQCTVDRIRPIANGGFLVFGGRHGDGPVQVMKLSVSGDILWQRRFGGRYTYAGDVIETTDGGFLFSCRQWSLETRHTNAMLVKLNGTGDVLWERSFGGEGYDSLGSIKGTPDGGFIAAGGSLSGIAGSDIWVVKLDASGGLQWQKTYGTSLNEGISSINVTPNDSYLLAGSIYSEVDYRDKALLVSIDGHGRLLWSHIYGSGQDDDQFFSAKPTPEGGILVAGSSWRWLEGSVFWLSKLDGSGNLPACEPASEAGLISLDGRVRSGTLSLASSQGHMFPVELPLDVSEGTVPGVEETCRNEVVRLLEPHGLEILPSGVISSITWEPLSGVASVCLELSRNDGRTWQNVGSGLTSTAFDWNTPTPYRNLTRCLVRASAFDFDGKLLDVDATVAPFSIEVIRVVSPNGGERFNSGSRMEATWLVNATAAPVSMAKLYLSTDNGFSWSRVGRSLEPQRGYFTIPTVDQIRHKCLLKVNLFDASGKSLGSDRSDAVFIITP